MAIAEALPWLATLPGVEAHIVKFVGGAAAVTKVYGKAVTVTYVGSGVVNLVWDTSPENPGTCLGILGFSFQASTPGDVAGHTVVADDFVTATSTLPITIFNGSDTGHDLAASEWLTLVIGFTREDV